MSKKEITAQNKTVLEFDSFFSDIYGQVWPLLRASLQEENKSVPFIFPGHNKAYFMDQASIIAAQTLPIFAGDRVLDLCAAPGGKTLILASFLSSDSTLIANELSALRRERLRRVIAEHVPADIQARIQITRHDASRWCLYEKNIYNAILLDAPCSSERHLVAQGEEKQWSQKRSKALAIRQYAMLASAIEALQPNGVVLYSTCSISPFENDGVIEKLLKKKKTQVQIEKICKDQGQATKHGWIILPHVRGHGPMYFCLIKKL